jgi:hypothetical protein
MVNIQKKSLQHVSKLLTDFNSYNIYSSLSSVLDKLTIDAEVKKSILGEYGAFQQSLNTEKLKITEAKEWIKSILEDLK